MRKIEVKKGDRYGRLVILKETKTLNKQRRVICKCDCGNETNVYLGHLRKGATKSCGCIIKENKTTHGMSSKDIYVIRKAMIQRCNNKISVGYSNYGGRGITVCERWLESFENFYEDMGERPSKKHSIDRIDNNGNYCNENCRWATDIEQANNQRKNIFVSINNVRVSFDELAIFFGLTRASLYKRIFINNWDLEKALTTRLLR